VANADTLQNKGEYSALKESVEDIIEAAGERKRLLSEYEGLTNGH